MGEQDKSEWEGFYHRRIQKYKLIKEKLNVFSVDPVICELRKINKLDCLIEGKLNYTLGDGNVVAINESTQDYLNKVLQNQTEIIEYMREGKDNFLHVLEKLEG